MSDEPFDAVETLVPLTGAALEERAAVLEAERDLWKQRAAGFRLALECIERDASHIEDRHEQKDCFECAYLVNDVLEIAREALGKSESDGEP